MAGTLLHHIHTEIKSTPCWLHHQVLSDQLYERVSIVLKSHGLGHFSDLCSAEQVTLLEEAHREILCEDNKVGTTRQSIICSA